MDTRVHIADRLRRSFDPTNRHAVAAQIANLLSPGTPEELERRRAHLLALILIAIVCAMSHVTGWTDRHAQYTVYVVAIAVAAVAGGTAPGCVAALAAVLLASAGRESTSAPPRV
jgi:K+-sensing histidine kinase KdpD